MFDVPNTAANAATAAAVNARLEADASLNRAKARTWFVAGVGGLLALLGIGVGAAFAGYHFSYQKVQLDNTTLKLADTTLKLDASGATVKLDASGATVRMTGGGFPSAPTVQPQSGGKVIVNYDIFHFVDFGGGQVVTDWSYRSSEDAAPATQVCRFQTITGASSGFHVWTIAENGTAAYPPPSAGFDVAGALPNCVWFR